MAKTQNTARRSTGMGSKAPTDAEKVAFAATSPLSRIIPLNHGLHCRIANPLNGKNMHLSTSSDEFNALLAELGSLGMRDRLISEMTVFANTFDDSAWPEVLARVTADGGPLGVSAGVPSEAT
jgi:hypothetical protein